MADPPELHDENGQDDEDETTETNEDDHRLISDAEETDDVPLNVDPESNNRQGDEELKHGNAAENEQIDNETDSCRNVQQPPYHQIFHGPQHHSHLMVQGYPYPHSTPPQGYPSYDQHHPYIHHTHSAPYYPPLPSYGLPAPHPPHQHFYHPNPHPMMPVFPLDGNNVQPTSSFVNNSGSMNNAATMAHVYHEQAARMRDHAAAYANAAAGAAWAAAQIANAAAEFASSAAATSALSPNVGFLPHQTPPLMFPQLPTPGNASGTLNRYETSELPYGGAMPNLPSRKHNNSLEHEHKSNTETEESFPDGYEINANDAYHKGHHNSEETISPNGQAQPKRPPDSRRNQRKRMQRLFPDDSQGTIGEVAPPGLLQSQQRGKIRRRLRSDCDSSTTSSGSSFMPQNGISRRRSGNHHYKKKARSDESLRGKTAVAALFEWCSKRQITPNFVLEHQTPDDFDYLVYLDGGDEPENKVAASRKENAEENDGHPGSYDGEKVWGRGRGRNKVAAKQDAARRTLQMLIPGVVFDDNTGILVDLAPPTPVSNSVKNSLDELAPNLAKQLAIGQSTVTNQSTKQSHQSKRTLDIYPGTSTTSEDEDENTYYTSRGASVCSVLLHAIVQIDTERILEVPSFTYHVSPPAQLLAGNSQQSNDGLRRKGSSRNPLPAVRAARGSFTCTARLKIRAKIKVQQTPGRKDDNEKIIDIKIPKASEKRSPDDISVSEDAKKEQRLVDDQKQEAELVDKFSTLGKDSDSTRDAQPTSFVESVLETVGTGGSKREARHIASAKLLALLFPDCKDMVEVKTAAEAMREKYAASKMSKLQNHSIKYSHRQKESTSDDRPLDDEKHNSLTAFDSYSSCFAMSNARDPSVPREICERIQTLLESRPELNQNKRLNDTSDNSQSEFEDNSITEYGLRYLNRLKQLDYRVECALQMLNDRDEEGRALPEELTADDVGRLVLRRAEHDDYVRIKRFQFFTPDKLHREKHGSHSPKLESERTDPIALILDTEMKNSSTKYEVGNSYIILLLCRAIAAFEDPPLGCAILSLGFSIEQGCLLQLVGIAREKHLPMERFLDCLQNFAGCMKCDLESRSMADKNFVELTSADITSTIESYLNEASDYNLTAKPSVRTSNRSGTCFTVSTTKLQSVKEESEVSDSSTNEKRAGKRATKPSKRSRFE